MERGRAGKFYHHHLPFEFPELTSRSKMKMGTIYNEESRWGDESAIPNHPARNMRHFREVPTACVREIIGDSYIHRIAD